MSKLVWDETGTRKYETGVNHGVLYPQDETGKYPKGVAWNGLTSVTESPSGAEETVLYADNIKYASLRSAEQLGLTIEAYQYPDEFEACDGSAAALDGVYVGQQNRQPFGFVYRTEIGNDTASTKDDSYKLHLVYGCTASPSEEQHQTVNDSPDAVSFSWEVTTTPVAVENMKPTSCITIDSTKITDKSKLAALEDILFGKDAVEARLPMPDEVFATLKNS